MRENRKTAGGRAVCLLLAFALLIGVLPARAFAQGEVETVVQALEELNGRIGNRLSVETQGSTVTVSPVNSQESVDLGNEKVALTIPQGVTVDWKASIHGNATPLVEISGQSAGVFRLTDGMITVSSGTGIKVLSGSLEMSGGKVIVSSTGETGVEVTGQTSHARISGADIGTNGAGTALKISNESTVHIDGGWITSTETGGKAITADHAELTISGGFVRCDRADTITLTNQSTVNISGGTIRNSGTVAGTFVLNASGDSSVSVAGGSIKGNVNGLTAANFKNASGEPVYRVTLQNLPFSSDKVEALLPQGYGTKDVSADENGQLYVYVPAGHTEFKLKVGSKVYYGKADVQENPDNVVSMTDKYLRITEQPPVHIRDTYVPNLNVTLRVRAEAYAGATVTYQWYSKRDFGGMNFEPVPNGTGSTLTLRNVNAGRIYYYCVLKAGDAEVRTNQTEVEIASARYTGPETGNMYVKSDQETENVTYTLPTLPQGLWWERVSLRLGDALIAGNPTLSGNVLSFNTTARQAGDDAQLTVSTNDNNNYWPIHFLLTVTVQGKTGVQIAGLTQEDATYDGKPHRGYSGNVRTAPYTGSLEYQYTGRNGTHYDSTEAPTAAGDYTVKISVPSNDPDYIGDVSFDFAIAKRNIRVKAENKSMVVGQPLPPLTYAVIGQVNGETALNGQPHLSTAADGQTVGTFDITVDMAGVSYAENYQADNPASEKGRLTVLEPVPPRYEVSVNPTEWDFGRVLQNEMPRAKEFEVRNTGNQTLRSLELSLSGEDAEKFELSDRSIDRLDVNQQQIITVRPKKTLPAGEYYAALEIQGSPRVSAKVLLRFEVVSLPVAGEYREWETKTDVPWTKEWNIRFNGKLDGTTVTNDNVFMVSAANPYFKIPANLRLSEDGTVIHIQPKQPLNGQQKYFLIIQKIRDESGKTLKQNIVMPFMTV